MKKMLKLMVVATLFAGGAAACGSDDDDDSPTTQADTEETTGGDSENADVAAFCAEADDVAAQLTEVMADPTKAAEIQELITQQTELAARAAELTSANADDSDEINACLQKVADAATP